jgi:CheY-like chemotaxis protein
MSYVPVVVGPASRPRKTAILLVEDEVLVRAMFGRCVRGTKLCWRRQITYEAYDILQPDAAIDVMFTDPRLPRVTDAVAQMTAARGENPDLKWVAAMAELPDPRPRARLDGYFPRPCDLTQLVHHLEALCARDRPARLKRTPRAEQSPCNLCECKTKEREP